MRKVLITSIVFVIFTTMGISCFSNSAETYYNVGVCIKDITPSEKEINDGNVYLGGYGIWKIRFPWGPIKGVHDPVYARSMVIELDGQTIAIAVLDTIGIGNEIILEIQRRVTEATGIDKYHQFICATHTHLGPDLQGIWGGVSDSYKEYVIASTSEAIIEAYNSRNPANLYVSGKNVEGLNRNRRGLGYTDETLTVLDAISINDNKRIGTIINFSAHPIVVNMVRNFGRITRDYPGYLVDYAGKKLDAPVLFMNGVVGDATPDGIDRENYHNASKYGRLIAKEAIESMENQILVDREMVFHVDRMWNMISNTVFQFVMLSGLAYYDIERIKYEFPKGIYVRTQTAYFRLGTQLQGVSVPGEATTRLGERIKESLSEDTYKLFFSLSSDSLGYLIPSDEWKSGGMEESVSLDKYMGDNVASSLEKIIGYDDYNNKQSTGKRI